MKITEEKICNYVHSDNGASPVWCFGSTVIARSGDNVFCTVPQAGFGAQPLSDRHIELYRKSGNKGFELVWRDDRFTREPAPLLMSENNTLLMTANPMTAHARAVAQGMNGYSEPLFYSFSTDTDNFVPEITRLVWDDPGYIFMDHSYRGFAIDRENGNILLTQQYITKGAGEHCYAVTDLKGRTMKAGKLAYPVRNCYHNLAIKNSRAYIMSVSDIIEPVEEWRQYKFEKTGIKWDYDFRNIYLKYTDDVLNGEFSEPLLVDSREDTCGHMSNIDIYVDDMGVCHLLYSAKRLWHGFMRDRFFPETPFDCGIYYRRFENGTLSEPVVLDVETELPGEENVNASYWGAFHELKDGTLSIILSKKDANGTGRLSNGWHIGTAGGAFDALDIETKPGMFLSSRQRCGNTDKSKIDMLLREEDKIQYVMIDLEKEN